MKKLFLIIALALSLAVPAMAFEGDILDTVFANVSGTGTIYTSSVKVSRYQNKQAQFIGYRPGGTFTNLSGTVGIQISQDNSNWIAASIMNPADGTSKAITRTTNDSIFWRDGAAYVRFYFTKTVGAVKIWFRQMGNN